jgi:hypothetical protein
MSNKVEYNGKVYEIGKYYSSGKIIGMLSKIAPSLNEPFTIGGWQFSRCEQVIEFGDHSQLLGSIEDAPFSKPERGKSYLMKSKRKPNGCIRTFSHMNNNIFVDSEGGCWPKCRPAPVDQRVEYGE